MPGKPLDETRFQEVVKSLDKNDDGRVTKGVIVDYLVSRFWLDF